MTIRSMKIHQLDSKINNNQLVQFSYRKITGESTLKMLNTKKKYIMLILIVILRKVKTGSKGGLISKHLPLSIVQKIY